MLSEMGISINAIGSASDAEIEGIKTKLVEKLIKARSVDFVTEPGAGGSVEFYESERINIDLIEINQLKELRPDLVEVIKTETRTELTREVKRTMEMEEKVKELEGQITTLTTERDELKTKMEEAARAQKKAEAKSLIDEAVGKSELPEAAKSKILEKFKDVETADGIEEAIKSEKDYIASIQESGKVKGLGKTEVNVVENHKALVESFKKLGLSDKEAETAAEGR
jgi:seryl-tRNA synthetase